MCLLGRRSNIWSSMFFRQLAWVISWTLSALWVLWSYQYLYILWFLVLFLQRPTFVVSRLPSRFCMTKMYPKIYISAASILWFLTDSVIVFMFAYINNVNAKNMSRYDKCNFLPVFLYQIWWGNEYCKTKDYGFCDSYCSECTVSMLGVASFILPAVFCLLFSRFWFDHMTPWSLQICFLFVHSCTVDWIVCVADLDFHSWCRELILFINCSQTNLAAII